MPPLHCETGITYTTEDKVEGVVDTLEKQFSSNEDESRSSSDSSVSNTDDEEAIEENQTVDHPLQPVTYQEVQNVLKILKNHVAPGVDKIPNLA